MGVVTKTIGTSSRDYSTVQAWEDALPANLITDGNSQVGECYNDSELAQVTFAGSTADATNNITLKCATGQSFNDNANKQTNALRYNQSNGVGLRRTSGYFACVIVSEDFVILQDLQIAYTGGASFTSGGAIEMITTSRTNCQIVRCICEDNVANSNSSTVRMRSGQMYNSLCVKRSSGNGVHFDYAGTISFIGNTIVRPTGLSVSGSALQADSGTTTITNCALFGFTNSVNNTSRFAGSNNASDVAIGFGSSNQASKTYANQFVATADASRDFRTKTGADLLNNGVTSATYGTPDIVDTTRPQGSAYDIGCWELVVAASNTDPPFTPSQQPNNYAFPQIVQQY